MPSFGGTFHSFSFVGKEFDQSWRDIQRGNLLQGPLPEAFSKAETAKLGQSQGCFWKRDVERNQGTNKENQGIKSAGLKCNPRNQATPKQQGHN